MEERSKNALYIKRLEIYGFKSFPYKTVVPFSSGLTAIVGPNGAGKSNLLDAIKWVLGEGSPKRLRVKEMADLIYTDNNGRRIDFAEVKLILAHDPPIIEKYKDYSEISVVRRFYRDGVGEFFINQKPVRLRDIHLLFLELGISHQSYCIIDQGEISKFLELSPKERKIFLEDLAGVSKVKLTETEVAKNLEKTEFNLLRLKDLLVEVERQYHSLKEQAERAKIYLNTKRRYLFTSLALTQKSIDRFTVDLKELKEKIEKLKVLKDELEKKEEEYEELENQKGIILAELSHRIRFCQEEIKSKERELERIRTTLKDFYRQEKELETKKEKETWKISYETEKIQRTEKELSTLKEAVKKLVAKEKELLSRKEDLQKVLEKAKDELRQKKEEIKTLGSLIQEFLRKRDRLRERKRLLEGQIRSYEDFQRRVEADLQQAKNRGRDFAERLSLLKEKRVVCQRVLEEKKQKQKEFLHQREELTQRALDLKEGLIFLSSQEKRIEKNLEFLLNVINKALPPHFKKFPQEKILGYRLSHLSAEELRLLEVAYGERLKSFVGKDWEELEELAREVEELLFIREEDLVNLPLTIKIITKFSEFNPEERTFFYHKEKGFLITSDGFVISLKKTKANLFSLQKEKENLEKEKEVLSQQRSSLEEEKKNLSKAQERLDEELKILEKEIHKLEGELKELSTAERDLEMAVFRNSEALKRFSQELEEAKEKLGEVFKELAKLQQDLEEVEREYKNYMEREKMQRESLEKEEAHFASLQEEIASLEKELVGIRTKKSHLLEHEKVLRDELAKASSSLREAKLRLERYSRELKVIKDEMTNFTRKKQILLEDLTSLQGTLSKLSKEEEREEELLKQIQSQKREAEKKLKNVLTELHNQSLKAQEVELLLKKYGEERQSLEESLGENSWESDPLFLEVWSLREKELAEHIEALKKELKDLGEVNLQSIKEFEMVSRRYEELLTHKKDLEKSIESLKKILADLTEEARRRLKKTLAEVNKQAKEVFQEIFPGAEAELYFTEEDPLLSGLEVKIRIPYKNVRSLNMLSGGEKALCVIAFLLSFYLVNPSPFLILDEVDAPLDEKNALKFISLLKKITYKSQVLLITHNPQVMKEVDLLLGVTMEERGISKIVELKLKEILPQE